jgi:SPP1 family predicted phage head-tail adaptor
MQSGAMDRRIRIDQAQEVRSESGEIVQTWLPLITTWAERNPLQGSELFQAQQIAAKVDTRYRVRYRSDVTPGSDLRVVDLSDQREYDITAVLEIGRREGLELLASARAE